MAAPRVGNLIWIDWCLAVPLFRDASPDVDGLMFDCVAVVWTALSLAVWLSRLAASEWMTCFYAVMLSWLPSPECITQCCVTSLPPVLVYLLWIAWCLAVSLSCVATPDLDGPVFDCVDVVCIADTGVDFLVIGCLVLQPLSLGCLCLQRPIT